jgi:hypothetical protein
MHDSLERGAECIRARGRDTIGSRESETLQDGVVLSGSAAGMSHTKTRDRVVSEHARITRCDQLAHQHQAQRHSRHGALRNFVGLKIADRAGEHELTLQGQETQQIPQPPGTEIGNHRVEVLLAIEIYRNLSGSLEDDGRKNKEALNRRAAWRAPTSGG